MGTNATIEVKKGNELVATGKFPATLKSCNILDKYEKQENADREMEQRVKGNKVAKLQDAFREFLGRKWDGEETDAAYLLACRAIKSLGISHTAEDARLFSVSLVQFQDEKNFEWAAGLFLSAVINRSRTGAFLPGLVSRGREIVIDTRNLSDVLHCVGYKNRKNVVVNGNVGNRTGHRMHGGSIVVNGNACNRTGWEMESGRIVVNGNVSCLTGMEMLGGEIMVHGNAASETGHSMEGGRILVDGDAFMRTGCDMLGGRILVKGNAANGTGAGMAGGRITVNGDSGNSTGANMKKGRITVHGDAGENTGYGRQGGKIIVDGKVKIGPSYPYEGKSNVYQGKMQLVKNGREVAEAINE